MVTSSGSGFSVCVSTTIVLHTSGNTPCGRVQAGCTHTRSHPPEQLNGGLSCLSLTVGSSQSGAVPARESARPLHSSQVGQLTQALFGDTRSHHTTEQPHKQP